MEAKRILCFVLILVCLAEARDLKRQDSRHNRMYGFYSDYSYMDPYSSAGYPGYSSMDPYSSAGYPGYSYMDPYSSAGYPGYSSMDPYSSAGYPGYSYMDPYTSAGYPGYNSMDPYSSAGYHGYSYMDPYSSAGYPGYSYMDPYSMHNNPIDSSASYMGYSNNIDLYSSIDTYPVSSINDYSSDYQSSWESFSNYFDSSYSRFPSSNYDDYYPDMGIYCTNQYFYDYYDSLDTVSVLKCVVKSECNGGINFYALADCMEYNGLVPPDYRKRGFKRAPEDGGGKPEHSGEDKQCGEEKAILGMLCGKVEEEKKRAGEGELTGIEKILEEICPKRPDPAPESGPKPGDAPAPDKKQPQSRGSKRFPAREPLLKNRNAEKIMRLINQLKQLH